MKIKFLLALILLYGSISLQAQNKLTAEDYVKLTKDGAWCWFSDPRAIYIDGKYYGGYIDSEGLVWAFAYHPATQQTQTTLLFEKFKKDDHANPSIAQLPDGKLVLFFSGHGGMENTPIYYRITTRKNDISEFGPLQSITPGVEGPRGTCYSNLAILSSEKNRMYLFFRGADFKPNMVYSDDLKLWSPGKPLIKDFSVDDKISMVRPYMKVSTNNKDRIHFAFTDGHPRNDYRNSIYYLRYRNGQYETASGKLIGTDQKLPFSPDQCDKVYDASATLQRAWIWDVAYDKNEYPVIVYARFISELQHTYWYARWDGKQWINAKITDAGQWFPRFYMPKEGPVREPHYSGGVYLDHKNPDIVYLSKPVNDVFEIQRWTTSDMGKSWTTDSITRNSSLDNVRPFVAHNDPDSKPMWMYNYKYEAYIDGYQTALRIGDVFRGYSPAMDKKNVKEVMKAVADWQISDLERSMKNHTTQHKEWSWVNATLYLGIFQWASISGGQQYFDWLSRTGRRNQWQVGQWMYHADDICIGQMYLKMYEKFKNENMLTPTRARAEWVIDHRSESTLELNYADTRTLERWSWCDALFMAPPVYAQLAKLTGNNKFLDFMDQEYRATYDYLFDKDENLFYRDWRYFNQKEFNGKKVFWGRGNGWVLGGLANLLEYIPQSNPKRLFYENLFKSMCARIARLQGNDGFWHASLLDPGSYPSPETSASGFMVYALAYGINHGLLDKKEYYPVVEKGWKALVSSVNEEGKLGWVQPVGADPKKVTRDMTELYGIGAFLLAGAEIYQMAGAQP